MKIFRNVVNLVNSDKSIWKCQSSFFWIILNNIVKILWKTYFRYLKMKMLRHFSFVLTVWNNIKFIALIEGMSLTIRGRKGPLQLWEDEMSPTFGWRDVSYLGVKECLLPWKEGMIFKGRRHLKFWDTLR